MVGVARATRGKITDVMIVWDTSLAMKSGVVNGALSTNVPPLIASCPTGNCTWPITPSMAICGECTNITSYQTNCFESECEGTDNFCIPKCNYTMPSGSTITLVNFTHGNVGIGDDAFRVMPGKGSIYNSSDPSRLYVANLDIFGVNWTNAKRVASECALWFCVQTFNTTVTGSNQQQNVIESFSTIVSSKVGSATTFAELPPSMLPPSMQSRVPTIYEVEFLASGALSKYLSTALNGTASLDTESIGYSSDIMQAI